MLELIERLELTSGSKIFFLGGGKFVLSRRTYLLLKQSCVGVVLVLPLYVFFS
jgi:hypothetical protein